MSRDRAAAVILLVAAIFAAAESRAEGQIALFLGQKDLDDADWAKPLDSQDEIGMHLSVGRETWKVRMAVDFLVSMGDDDDREAAIYELNGGVRKFWSLWKDRIRPFAGGGLAFVKAERSDDTVLVGGDSDDFAGGLWIDGGAMFKVRKKFSLGLDLRYSTAEIKLGDDKIDAGGTHAGLLVGWTL
jgi:opacity protein-like surface antigen